MLLIDLGFINFIVSSVVKNVNANTYHADVVVSYSVFVKNVENVLSNIVCCYTFSCYLSCYFSEHPRENRDYGTLT